MEMYLVRYRCDRSETEIEHGSAVAMGVGEADVIARASYHLKITAENNPKWSAEKLKPALWQVDSAKALKIKHDKRTAQNDDAPIFRRALYVVSIVANVLASSENGALKKLAAEIRDKASHKKAESSDDIDISEMHVERKEEEPRTSAIERQAIYKEKRIFQGGAARPR